jgi:uncharacterized protein YvpB
VKTRKALVAAGVATLSVSMVTLAGGPLLAHAALQARTCSSTAFPSAGHLNVCLNETAVYLNAPAIHQNMPLDCESAALAVALQTKGLPVTQAWVFAELPKQPQQAVISAGRPAAWGDPYAAFVGNVYGSESNYSGYGVYYPPIVAAAERAGIIATGRTGWTTIQIEMQIKLGHPVIVWINYNFGYSRTSSWKAWDGRVIPYTTQEHTVTVIGFNSLAGTVTVIDVGVGLRRTISTAQFTSAIATFGGMGVEVG